MWPILYIDLTLRYIAKDQQSIHHPFELSSPQILVIVP